MIIACKAHLNVNGTLNIWHDAKSAMIARMKDCIELHKQYYDCFKAMINSIHESSEGKTLEISEMYVFGKFNTFKTRLNKLIDVMEITVAHSILQSSRIEGINLYAKKFVSFFQTISSQTYDPLDHRKPLFDYDYDEFKKNVAETQLELRSFFFKTISYVLNIDGALKLVLRY